MHKHWMQDLWLDCCLNSGPMADNVRRMSDSAFNFVLLAASIRNCTLKQMLFEKGKKYFSSLRQESSDSDIQNWIGFDCDRLKFLNTFVKKWLVLIIIFSNYRLWVLTSYAMPQSTRISCFTDKERFWYWRYILCRSCTQIMTWTSFHVFVLLFIQLIIILS